MRRILPFKLLEILEGIAAHATAGGANLTIPYLGPCPGTGYTAAMRSRLAFGNRIRIQQNATRSGLIAAVTRRSEPGWLA
jgi:hypothetical protein